MAVLLGTNFYRAATQSLVHDEALTWQLYLAGPASAIFQQYDPNHHFLATVLFRVSTTLFGQSEFAMRLPTVLAGAWFFWTVFQLSALVLGDGWLLLLGCSVLTLNPILLDFLVAARGYGLAMAGLFWGLFQMLAWMDEGGAALKKARFASDCGRPRSGIRLQWLRILLSCCRCFCWPARFVGCFCGKRRMRNPCPPRPI